MATPSETLPRAHSWPSWVALRKRYNDYCIRNRGAGRYKVVVPRLVDKLNRTAKQLAHPLEVVARISTARRARHQPHYPIAGLRRDGFMPLTLPAGTLAALRQAAWQKRDTADWERLVPKNPDKAFFTDLLTREELRPGNVFFDFALDETLLNTIALYLGGAPFLEYTSLIQSTPRADGRPTSSQLWHRDRTDDRLAKVFVYMDDVTSEHGPLTMLPKAETNRVPFYLEYSLSDHKLGKHARPEKAVALTGEGGAAFLVDTTACYHFGSRCQKPRLALILYYNSGFGYYLRETDWSALRPLAGTLSPLQRLALGL